MQTTHARVAHHQSELLDAVPVVHPARQLRAVERKDGAAEGGRRGPALETDEFVTDTRHVVTLRNGLPGCAINVGHHGNGAERGMDRQVPAEPRQVEPVGPQQDRGHKGTRREHDRSGADLKLPRRAVAVLPLGKHADGLPPGHQDPRHRHAGEQLGTGLQGARYSADVRAPLGVGGTSEDTEPLAVTAGRVPRQRPVPPAELLCALGDDPRDSTEVTVLGRPDLELGLHVIEVRLEVVGLEVAGEALGEPLLENRVGRAEGGAGVDRGGPPDKSPGRHRDRGVTEGDIEAPASVRQG